MASEDLTARILSGSTSGRPIIVAATATPGTVIHTPASTAPDLELLTLDAWNTGTVTRTLTLEWGHASSTLPIDLEPGAGPIRIATQYPIQAASNVVRAFADAADEVLIIGRVTYYEAPT